MLDNSIGPLAYVNSDHLVERRSSSHCYIRTNFILHKRCTIISVLLSQEDGRISSVLGVEMSVLQERNFSALPKSANKMFPHTLRSGAIPLVNLSKI